MSIFQRNMVSVIALSTLMALAPATQVLAQEDIVVVDEMTDEVSVNEEAGNETVKAIQDASTGTVEETDKDGNPYIKQIERQAAALAKSLTIEQSSDLQKIRTAFGMIESVDMVHSHVGAAVKNCKEQYPDLEVSVQDQFDSWQRRVLPVAEHQKEILHTAINDGRFTDAGAIKTYLETIDKAAEFTDSRLVRNPVITEQTCKGLAASMNNTKEELVSLMNDIDWPEGVDATPLPDPTELIDMKQTEETPAEEVSEEVMEAPSEEVVEEVVEEAAEEMTEEVSETVEQATGDVHDAAEAVEETTEEVTEELMEEATEAVKDAEDIAEEITEEVSSDGTVEVEVNVPAQADEMKIEVDADAPEKLTEPVAVSEEDMKKALAEMERQNRENSMKSENELMEMEIKQELGTPADGMTIEIEAE